MINDDPVTTFITPRTLGYVSSMSSLSLSFVYFHWCGYIAVIVPFSAPSYALVVNVYATFIVPAFPSNLHATLVSVTWL